MTWPGSSRRLAPAIHWFHTPDADAGVWRIGVRWLDHHEGERASRFVFELDRLDFIASRMLLRGVLGSLLGCRPEDLVFKRGSFGKPYLQGGALQFNLSHTRGASVLMVGPKPGVGVDIERLDRMGSSMDSLHGSVLTDRERSWLALAAGTSQYQQRWARLWTAKEALLKFDGSGIGRFELNHIEVAPTPGSRVIYTKLPTGVRADYPAAGWCCFQQQWLCSWVGAAPRFCREFDPLHIDQMSGMPVG